MPRVENVSKREEGRKGWGDLVDGRRIPGAKRMMRLRGMMKRKTAEMPAREMSSGF